MTTIIKIDPITRIEGHLEVEIAVESGIVVDAYSSGTMFRGFENILIGRDPRDASILTQRICGVCPISHAMAATLNLESAFGVLSPGNGRILPRVSRHPEKRDGEEKRRKDGGAARGVL